MCLQSFDFQYRNKDLSSGKSEPKSTSSGEKKDKSTIYIYY